MRPGYYISFCYYYSICLISLQFYVRMITKIICNLLLSGLDIIWFDYTQRHNQVLQIGKETAMKLIYPYPHFGMVLTLIA